MAREILFDLGKMITDRLPYKFGLKRLTETDPEYIILDRACSSDFFVAPVIRAKKNPALSCEILSELRSPSTTFTPQSDSAPTP